MRPLPQPQSDPAPIFEAFRGSYGSELLIAAVAHFDLFGKLAHRSMTSEELAAEIGLVRRPSVVLFTALRAMGLIAADPDGRFSLTPMAREHLVPGGEFDVGA